MGELHRTRAYLSFARGQRKRIEASLPQPCLRCGVPIQPGDAWDLDHIVPVSLRPDGLLNPANVRPAHRSCNRRAGQKITEHKRRRAKQQQRMPNW